jgi:hypothetical protein
MSQPAAHKRIRRPVSGFDNFAMGVAPVSGSASFLGIVSFRKS